MNQRITRYCFGILLFFSGAPFLSAQDFIMQGCYWSCPEETDSLAFAKWRTQLQKQAPELAYAGFTYLSLPNMADSLSKNIPSLIQKLRAANLEPITDLTAPKEGAIFQSMQQNLQNELNIKAFRIRTKGEPEPLVVANFLNAQQVKEQLPELIFADIPNWQEPIKLANWIAKVTLHLTAEAKLNVSMRAYDYPLREALRRASTDATYDVRAIYDASLRDRTTLTGFNVVTLANGTQFNNQNGKANDWDDPIVDPLLAYAYLLTNNQIGLPAIFYNDYYGKNEKITLKQEIDQLIRAHQQFIFNATAVEYLNHPDSKRTNTYMSAKQGADASKTLIFQMDGSNTLAGQAAQGRRDVIVAINFSDERLQLVQEINMSNITLGDVFSDVLGRSLHSSCEVINDGQFDIPNSVYIELPPRSYSIWVQGAAKSITYGSFDLQVEAFDSYVELSWEIPAGRENITYQIERSINQSKFQPIATMEALGEDKTGAAYLYVDEERMPDDEVYYRVKARDKNGKLEFSSVAGIKPVIQEMGVEVLNCDKRGLKTIKVRSNVENSGKLAVFNAAGEQVMTRALNIRQGITQVELDLSAFPKGVYFVQFSTNKKKEWMKKVVNL